MNLPLSTAFTESHRFWVVVFSFSFVSVHILISFFISSMIYWLFRSMLFILHMFVSLIIFFFPVVDISSYHIVIRKDAWNDFSFCEFTKARLWPRMWSVLENVPCALEGKVKFIVLGWNVLLISIKSSWSIVSFKVCVSLLIFCLVDLSIGVNGVLKSPTILVLLLISLFILVSICLMYWGAPMLGAYIFIIVTASSWIDPLIFSSILLCLFSWPLFQNLFYLIWVLLLLLSFGLHFHEISFSRPSLSVCMCPLFWGGSLVDSIYRVLFLYLFSQSLYFGWGIQPIFI